VYEDTSGLTVGDPVLRKWVIIEFCHEHDCTPALLILSTFDSS
jgi:hypothetical protein